jgi:hypothetical protein
MIGTSASWKELPEEGNILSDLDQLQMKLSDLSLYSADVTLKERVKNWNI